MKNVNVFIIITTLNKPSLENYNIVFLIVSLTLQVHTNKKTPLETKQVGRILSYGFFLLNFLECHFHYYYFIYFIIIYLFNE